MSLDAGVTSVRTEVDVDISMKENVLHGGISPDSGAETLDTASVSCPTLSDSEVSPTKHSESPISNDRASSVDLGLNDDSLSKSLSESLSSKNSGSPLPADSSPIKNDIIDNIADKYKDNLHSEELLENSETELININETNEANIIQSIENNQILVTDNDLVPENEIQPDNLEHIEKSETPVENLNLKLDSLRNENSQILSPNNDLATENVSQSGILENIEESESPVENSNLELDSQHNENTQILSPNNDLATENVSQSGILENIEESESPVENSNLELDSQHNENNQILSPNKDLTIENVSQSGILENKEKSESPVENSNLELDSQQDTVIQNENKILVTNNDLALENVPQPHNLENVEKSKTPVENSNLKLDSQRTETQNVLNLKTDLSTSDDNISNEGQNLKMEAKSALTMSTMSLTDHVQTNTISETKSPYSRSAENISIMDENVTIPSSSNSSTKDLNTEQILSDFTNQKNKVKATQKIVNETPQSLTNPANYARIPKELLSQDLGSIAKSVHGIFSSVSGSLKNAYNSQRVSVKMPVKTIKPVNGKVMNDIFEDNVPEPSHTEPSPENKINTEDSVTQSVTDEETDKDLTKLQIESLERVLAEQRKENAALRDRVKQQMDELQAKDQTFKELEAKVDLMCKRAEQAHKEKDIAVMRYASVECAAIEAKRAAEAAAKGERAAVAERELLNGKLRSARDERERICQLYDDKCHELKTSEMETAKLREELRELDGRLKWTQSKLRVEMDAYKESSERAEKLSQQVAELEAARETAAVNATDSAKAKQFEAELKESQAALILCRHEKEELEKRWSSSTQQLDTCRRERDDAREALARTTAQVEELKESNLRLEEEAAELAALRARAALADTLSTQLQRETERARVAEEALGGERARAETCARREAAALEHAAHLTAQHVAQRAAAAHCAAQAQALAADNASLREQVTSLEAECTKLRTACEEEAERRNRESRVLARKVAELTEEAADLSKKLEWEKGENSVLKKKHASAIKELNRELQRAMKRVEQLEAKVPRSNNDAPSTRTGSITSLSSGESAQEDRLQNGHAEPLPDVQPSGPLSERQALIERIVSLQRAAARRAERCEFLEEHARQLTSELRGKARLLRHVLPALPAGALASHRSDAHKKEIARLGGGAMAALWGGDADGLTPELALEVAKRMQAVLEDALLKNITLKENMDTLGEEIARLRQQVNATNEAK